MPHRPVAAQACNCCTIICAFKSRFGLSLLCSVGRSGSESHLCQGIINRRTAPTSLDVGVPNALVTVRIISLPVPAVLSRVRTAFPFVHSKRTWGAIVFRRRQYTSEVYGWVRGGKSLKVEIS